jgi:aspartate-semialdehyde dehydrogenase
MATGRRPAGPTRGANVALFDATTLIGKGVKDQLVARKFPIASVHLYTSSTDPDSNLSEFAGEAMLVGQPDIDALGPLDIAFLCGDRGEGALYLDWPGRLGFAAVDLTGASRSRPGIPVVNAAINPEALPEKPGLVSSPHPVALILSSVLAPLGRRCGLREATAVALQPVSERGEEGIGELYKQTLGLLNFQDMPQEVFGRQVAFNLVPAFAGGEDAAVQDDEAQGIETEVIRVTGGGFGMSVSVLLAPVFHCHAILARVVLGAGCGRGDLLAALATGDDVRVHEGAAAMTPVERAGEPGIMVSGVRRAGSDEAFWLWIVSDNLQSGTARNAVRIAEAMWERARARKETA